MNHSKFTFGELSQKGKLLEDITISLVRSRNGTATDQLNTDIEKHAGEKLLKIAFVGQYNSGKSTIISALTGNHEIKISNNVETDVAKDYQWNDVIITDTPGLCAGKKEEHDELSMRKINESDLLVFCITSSLFDPVILRLFLELAYGHKLKQKMFLVVNKMSMEYGNYEELKANYKASMEKMFSDEGKNINDFRLAFIDARDYLKGITSKDSEESEEYIKDSHFESFIEMLNVYIARSGMMGRLDVPCKLMLDTVDSEIANTKTEVDRKMINVLKRLEWRISSKKTECNNHVGEIVATMNNAIMGMAHDLVLKIGSDKIDDSTWDCTFADIRKLENKSRLTIANFLIEELDTLVKDLSEVLSTDEGAYLSAIIDSINAQDDNSLESFSMNSSPLKDYSKLKETVEKALPFIQSLGTRIKQMSLSDSAKKDHAEGGAGSGIMESSGSELHDLVLNLGHIFNYKFKPKQAVKTAHRMGNFGEYLAPTTEVLGTMGSMLGDAIEAHRIEQDRANAMAKLSSCAKAKCNSLNQWYASLEKASFEQLLENINQKRAEMEETNSSNNEYVCQLKAVRKKIEAYRASLV